jgi:class 3 adenylate cyclase
MKRTPAPYIAVALGFVVALLAGLVALRAGESAVAIVRMEAIGLVYLAAGGIAWHRRPDNAVGPLLVAIGWASFIPEFQAAPMPAVASLAFATRRIGYVLLAYLLLAYPSGRLGSRRHRWAIALVATDAAVQMAARLLFAERIPAQLRHIDRIAAIGCDCANPFAMAAPPGWLEAVELWTAFLSAALGLLVFALVLARLARASVPMRRVLWPVLFGAVVGLGVFAFNVLSLKLPALQTPLAGVLAWLLTAARVMVPIGFLIGLLRMKMDKAAVANLVVGLQGGGSADSLERSIAQALHDPRVRLGYWSAAAKGYLDGAGRPLELPHPGSGLSLVRVERNDEPLGAIVHDSALDEDKALLDAVSAAFALAVDRDRLASSVQAQASHAHRLPRGPVTFLYADIEGSTPLLDRLGERYADVLAEERRLVRTVVREHGGAEIDSRADEFFAAFPAGADPAGAAIAIQRRLRDRAWPDGVRVLVRIGLHSGQPRMTDEGYVGLDVHKATRVGSAGHGGQILLSEAARSRLEARLPPGALVQPLGAFALKGLPGPEPISQLSMPDLAPTFPPLRIASA